MSSCHRPTNFTPEKSFQIREIQTERMSNVKFAPDVQIRWEYLEYQAAPKNWVDRYAMRETLKKQAAAEKLKEEEVAFSNERNADKILEALEKKHTR